MRKRNRLTAVPKNVYKQNIILFCYLCIKVKHDDDIFHTIEICNHYYKKNQQNNIVANNRTLKS